MTKSIGKQYLVPNINAMMTGVIRYIVRDNGIVTLHYSDGSTETARPTRTYDVQDVFSVTSAVQAMRPEGLRDDVED